MGSERRARERPARTASLATDSSMRFAAGIPARRLTTSYTRREVGADWPRGGKCGRRLR